jgi:hypothetical protein
VHDWKAGGRAWTLSQIRGSRVGILRSDAAFARALEAAIEASREFAF